MNARGAEAEIGLKIIANHFQKPFLNANSVTLPLNRVLSLHQGPRAAGCYALEFV